jgi:hypothetical protein
MDGMVMDKGRIGIRWCRLLGVETVIAVYVSWMLLRCFVRGPVCATLVSVLAATYFAGVLICSSGPPQHFHRDHTCRHNPFALFCWLLALVEVLVYSRIRYL